MSYPPHGVADELKSACFVKLLSCLDESEVTFVNEVVECESLVLVLFGHRNDKSQVGSCEFFECFGVSFMNALCKFHFLIGRYEFLTSDFHQILIKSRA